MACVCGNKKAGRLCRVCFRPLGGGGLFICFLSFEWLRLSPLPVVEVQNVRFRVTRPPCCFAVFVLFGMSFSDGGARRLSIWGGIILFSATFSALPRCKYTK